MLGWNDPGAAIMNKYEVTILRVYITEGESLLNNLLSLLKDKGCVRGVTVFRGVAGFGPTGVFHSSSLSDLSLDLPLVLELFDEPSKIQRVAELIAQFVKPGHILLLPGQIYSDGMN